MTLDQLKEIAARVKPHTAGHHPRVAFGTDDPVPVEELVALGAKRDLTTWDAKGHRPKPYTIIYSELLVDGVSFEAQYSRDATPGEIAALSSSRAKRMTEDRAYVTP